MATIAPYPQQKIPRHTHTVQLLKRSWLSKKAFEIELSKPPQFTYLPGQRIRFIYQNRERDYSLTSIPDDRTLLLCVRYVENGAFSPLLSEADIGTCFQVVDPFGYFTFRKSPRKAVFVATGTGIAPFVSMIRSGISSITLLHGANSPVDLYYESLFRSSAGKYVPCLSGVSSKTSLPRDGFQGRVTAYLETHLSPGGYDFYLCGRNDMIRDVTFLVDDRFPGSYVYTEIYY